MCSKSSRILNCTIDQLVGLVVNYPIDTANVMAAEIQKRTKVIAFFCWTASQSGLLARCTLLMVWCVPAFVACTFGIVELRLPKTWETIGKYPLEGKPSLPP